MAVISSAGFHADVIARDANGNITGIRIAPVSIFADFIIRLRADIKV